MGAVKEMMMDCLDHGFVCVNPQSVQDWRARLAKASRGLLDGMPVKHPFETRSGEIVQIDVLPVPVARHLGRLLPDTHDELGWMIECHTETTT